MARKFVHMTCSEETKDSIMGECVELFKKAHPEREHTIITQWEMLRYLRNVYTGRKFYE